MSRVLDNSRPGANADGGRPYALIDLIRFASALMVMEYHLVYKVWQEPPADAQFVTAFRPIAPLFSAGWVGVEIFFVISGFVIAFSAQQKTVRQFVRGRVSRLYPAAWICATITLIATWQVSRLPAYAHAMLLLPVGPWISSVYWTLGVEIVFYTLVALALKQLGAQRLPQLAIALGCYSGIFWLAKFANHLVGGPLDSYFRPLEHGTGSLLLLHYGCDFALGMMIWRMTQTGLVLRTAVPMVAFAGIGLIGVTARSLAITHVEVRSAVLYPSLLWSSAVAAVFISARWNNAISARLAGRRRTIGNLGLMTYPLYLVHHEVGVLLMQTGRSIGPWPILLTTSMALILLAYGCVLLEKPIRRALWNRPSLKPATAV